MVAKRRGHDQLLPLGVGHHRRFGYNRRDHRLNIRRIDMFQPVNNQNFLSIGRWRYRQLLDQFVNPVVHLVARHHQQTPLFRVDGDGRGGIRTDQRRDHRLQLGRC